MQGQQTRHLGPGPQGPWAPSWKQRHVRTPHPSRFMPCGCRPKARVVHPGPAGAPATCPPAGREAATRCPRARGREGCPGVLLAVAARSEAAAPIQAQGIGVQCCAGEEGGWEGTLLQGAERRGELRQKVPGQPRSRTRSRLPTTRFWTLWPARNPVVLSQLHLLQAPGHPATGSQNRGPGEQTRPAVRARGREEGWTGRSGGQLGRSTAAVTWCWAEGWLSKGEGRGWMAAC